MLRVLLATAIGCSLTGAVGKAQTAYTYTVIADVTNCYNIAAPAINNKGEAAFVANCALPIGPASGGYVVRRGEGGALTPIYTWDPGSGTQYVPQPDVLSINDNGVVAFAVNGPCPNKGGAAIWTGDGGPISTVHDICAQPGFTSVIRPSISNTGAVAFMAASGNSYDFVVRAKNGTLVTIAGPGTSPTSVGTLTAAIEPSINNNDVVTFTGQGETAFGIFTGAGGAVTTISLDNPSIFNAVDDSGRVAFLANSSAVQTGDGGPVTTIATRTFDGGAYQSFQGSGASISAAGMVAFLASLPSGASGVFTGPDPEADVVLKTGDTIAGFGGVTGIGILHEAINDSGQIAMVVVFDQRPQSFAVAIIRADPPNSPPTAADGSASVTAGGSVSGTLSATDPDGDALTYAIVTNGTKGTAQITDASTGAATYTANAGTSGTDTFTFQVTDARGLASNVATVTVTIQPSPVCAVDVTSSIQQVKGKGAPKNTSTIHRLSLRNNSSAIAGPISLALDSLTSGVTLVNAAGTTACAAPAGSPYINVDVGPDSTWSSGEIVQIELTFSVAATPGKKSAIRYTTRVLAGAGGR